MAKVLIVEDDKFLASAYQLKFKKVGFDVHIASNGQEAINSVKTFVPDIIILDLIMPVKDGFTVLQELKADPAFKDIPIVVASNLGQQEDIDKALKMGATTFLIKTEYSLEKIVEMINDLIASHKSVTP